MTVREKALDCFCPINIYSKSHSRLIIIFRYLQGMTPLHYAIKSGSVYTISKLITKGSNSNIADTKVSQHAITNGYQNG